MCTRGKTGPTSVTYRHKLVDIHFDVFVVRNCVSCTRVCLMSVCQRGTQTEKKDEECDKDKPKYGDNA